jgi:glycosyltransferase involved in cell wall biosynthesis
MLNKKTVAVVVPAYNEERQIKMVLETMPDFVDRIIVVNDYSSDNTAKVVSEFIENDETPVVPLEKNNKKIKRSRYNEAELVVQQINSKEEKKFTPSEIIDKRPNNSRIVLINHLKNGGKGAAISTGYKWARDNKIDCTATMDGDGQMDPDELESICKPIVRGEVDYVKGNRLIHRSALLVVPKIRYLGNSILTILSKFASGYWHVSDTQTGYTAISFDALNAIRIHKIYKRYGYPNDMLVKLNIAMCSISEVPIKPVYNVGEKSKMKIPVVIPKISFLLIKSFFKRLWLKYFFRSFHPLFILFHLGVSLLGLSVPYGIKIIRKEIEGGKLLEATILAFMFLFISGMQFIFSSIWMDIQDNERLYK